MRLVKIENCSYAKYDAIRNAIMKVIPFAIINQDYSKAMETAVFNFWDSDYIPDEMKPFIVQPPLSRENKDKLKELLSKVM